MKDLGYFTQKYEELSNSKELKFINFVSVDPRIKVGGVPEKPGVYIIYERGKPIYVGSSGKGKANLRTRFHDLFYFNPNPKSKDPWNHTLSFKLMDSKKIGRFETIDQLREFYFTKCTFKFIEMRNVREAKVLEDLMILKLNPLYND